MFTRAFLRDLAERVATTAVYGIIAMLTADASGVVSGDPRQWWVVVGLPTVLALLKGILAGMADPETGASLLPNPPPRVESGHGNLAVAGFVLGLTAFLLVTVLVVLPRL